MKNEFLEKKIDIDLSNDYMFRITTANKTTIKF